MRERLMLNHIICLFNVFGYEPCMRMLEFKIKDEDHWSSIKTMLLYLDLIEEGWLIDYPIDEKLAQRLREL